MIQPGNLAVNPSPTQTGTGADQISVANLAALTAYVLPVPQQGITAWVRSLRTYFVLTTTAQTPAVDGITVVASSVAGLNWLRTITPPLSWSAIATWYVNATTGNDENPGNLSVVPLRTIEEWFRRLPNLYLSDYTVNIATNLATFNGQRQEGFGAGSRVAFKFATTTTISGDVTLITSPNVGGNNLPATLSVGAVADWTPYLDQILETTLPSGDTGYTSVGFQTVVGVAETAPWLRVPVNTVAGLWLPSGSSAAPAIGASVRVLGLVGVTGTTLRLSGDDGVSYNLITADLQTVSSGFIEGKQVVYTACKFRDGGLASTFIRPQQFILASGIVTGTAAGAPLPTSSISLGSTTFCAFYAPTVKRTAIFAIAGTYGTILGLTAFGCGITFGNTVSGPNAISYQTLASGSATGIGVHYSGVNATNNPGGDGIVVRSGAWLGSTSSQLYGISTTAGSVGVRVWGGGQLYIAPGVTPTITGALADFAIGSPTPATIVPPIVAPGGGVVPAAIAIAAGAGNGWNQWNTASPAGWGRNLTYAGSSLSGCQ